MGRDVNCLLSLTATILLFSNYVFAASSPKAEISCATTEECQFYIEGSTCDGTACKCTDDTTQSSDGTKCIAVVDMYGSACEETVQCSAGLNAGGVCLNNVCTCKDGYHYLQGKCWKSVKLGGSCSRTEQCYAAYDFIGLNCSSGVCECREKYYERAGGCRRIRSVGEDCAVETDCQCPGGGGKCNTRVCTCPGAFTTVQVKPPRTSRMVREAGASEKCEPGSFPCSSDTCTDTCALELGSSCSSADDRCAEGVLYAACMDDLMCGCESSLRSRAEDNRACNKVAQAINGGCVDGGQCAVFGEGAMCDQNKCVCSQDSHFDTNTLLCRSSKYVGDTCEVDEDCVTVSGGSVACTSGVCTCTPGSHPANGKLDCRPDANKVNDKCTEDSDCSFDHAVCDPTKKVCQCALHFFADASGACLQGIGSNCETSTECNQVADSFCNISSCDCTDGFVSSTDFQTCLKVNGFNETCVETSQCDPYLGDLKICNDGKCVCQVGAQYLLSKCYAIKALGEKCGARAECVPPLGDLEAYMCQNAICACQYGYQREGSICVPV